MASELCVQLLGEFDVTHGRERLDTLTSPRLQSFLAYLLLHRGAPQSRQHIAFLFWPDSTDSQARTNLRKALYDLRQALPEADTFVDADDHTVRWRVDAPLVLDVAAFEEALAESEQAARDDDARARQALARAADLYEGDLLPGCYDDWIQAERERLHARHLGALEQLAELHEQARDVRAAIETAQRLLRHDPLHEPAYRRLMRLHAAQGDRAGALHVYHTCVTILERELGVEPGEATQRAHQRLLETEAAPLAADRALPEAGVVTEAAAPEPEAARLPGLVASVPLVGRHPEWAQLVATWQQAARGESHALLVEGEAGIGKSRLAGELARWLARQGIRTAAARCYAAEGALPYAPVVAWLRALPLPALEPAWMSELARLLPELLDQYTELSLPGPMTEPWQRQRLFEALARAMLGSARPLLLLLDDLQWSDAETREWLHYLLRYDPQAPLLVLGTVRTEELGTKHPLLAWIQSLRHDEQLTEIELGRLDQEDTLNLAEHVAAHDLPPELASCIHGETGGNPLYVVEIVRARLAVDELEPVCPLQELPPRIQGAIEARLGQLSPQARVLADVAAVAGRGFSLGLLRASTGIEEDAAIVALDELWQRRVVAEEGAAAYDFTHDKLREVAYAGLSPVRRRQLHGHLAEALEQLHAGDLDPVAEEIAAHHDRAGQVEQAIPFYLHAGQVARRIYANGEATRHFERALELLAGVTTLAADSWRFGVLSELGSVHHWAGELGHAEEYLRRAIDVWPKSALPARAVGHVYHLLGRVLNQTERYDEAIRAGEEAMDLMGDDETSLEAVLIQGMMAAAYRGLGDWQRVEESATWMSALVDRLPYSTEVGHLYRGIYEVHRIAKHTEQAEHWMRRLEDRATVHGDLEGQRIAYELTGTLHIDRGEPQSAIPLFQRALALGAQIGHVNQQRLNAIRLVLADLDLGDLERAEQYARQEPEGKETLGIRRYLVWSHQVLGLVFYAQGKWRESTQTIERALTLAREWGRHGEEATGHCILGRIQLALGDEAAALAHFQQAALIVAPNEARPWHRALRFPYPRVLAEVLSGLEVAYGDTVAFRAFCDELRAINGDEGEQDPLVAQRMAAIGQWFLEPARPQDLRGFGKPRRSTSPGWRWTDPYGDCSYTLDEGLEIRAALGRDLWHINLSAPRLTRPAFGDLAIEAVVMPVDAEHLAIGGVLLWVDEQNYLRLDVGTRGPDEIHFGGCLANEDRYLGRGQLPPVGHTEGDVSDRVSPVHLRLERTRGQVRALCSRDGETWFSAGQVDFPEGDVQVGVHAIGNIDRTVYSGAHAEGTAIRFASVQLWDR
jgi:DNA-binding SARP family transcriptional activator